MLAGTGSRAANVYQVIERVIFSLGPSGLGNRTLKYSVALLTSQHYITESYIKSVYKYLSVSISTISTSEKSFSGAFLSLTSSPPILAM